MASLSFGMGHSVEGQVSVAKAIALQRGWLKVELWTESNDCN